ncbi:MAG TPA: helix-turn-helix domain-containing protein [Trebonia sp.]
MADSRLEPLVLSDAERRTLQGWATRRKTAQRLALRARIVPACAEGSSNTAVSARLGINRATARKWQVRFRPLPRTATDSQDEHHRCHRGRLRRRRRYPYQPGLR